jgi:hypothetical protein
MMPVYRDSHFTFRFADDRLVPRFHLDGIEPGRRVSVYRLDPATGGTLAHLTEAAVGEGGWVNLAEPLLMRAGEGFVAVPDNEVAIRE